MYGADGVNNAFEFDGTTYVPIHTGMVVDTPLHIRYHRSYLWLSYNGSAQFSALGQPYTWTVVLGAGEITTGEPITSFMLQGGNIAGAALSICTRGRLYVLYGSGPADFKLVPSVFDIGYSDYTLQAVGKTTYGLSPRGVQAMVRTQAYGDFDFISVTHMVQPIMTIKKGLEIASTTSRAKNQYRVFFSDGTALAIGLTGDQVTGIMPINYAKAVRCITTTNLINGTEVVYFGSDDGYVYQDTIGTSFDGLPIEAWIRPVFNHLKSPRIRKRYRRATFEVKASDYVQVNIAPDLGYASTDILLAAPRPDSLLIGAGGYWDQFTWDQFTWDTAYLSTPSISIEGTEKNISFLFYSNRAQDRSHTVQGVNLSYSLRRAER